MSNNQQIRNNLKVILGSDVEPNIISYISSMKHEEDYEEFMENILNKNNSAHINAYNAIKYALFGNKLKQKNKSHNQPLSNNVVQSSSNKNNQGPLEKSREIQNGTYGKKGKKKFKDIREFQEQKKEKEGRLPCDCMGQEHEFMNNCLYCGRIHCIKEGPGPCLFCGNEITVKGEVQSATNAKLSMKPKRNQIFDDDKDYFKMKAKETGDKRKMIVALDFASRKVIESTQGDVKLKEMLLEDSLKHLKKVEEMYKKLQAQDRHLKNISPLQSKEENELIDLLIQMRHKKPKEREALGEEDNKMPLIKYDAPFFDEDSIAKIDQGLCLSMHQPYASLLVAGVKRHEGRVWPTTHRGRLWIAAAAKEPEEDEIIALENFYKKFHNDPTLHFPKEYPTSCLLGCVTVEDCLDQETYKKTFGDNEESTSPYVMICSNPIILPIFYPISGKHKIYPLEKELHQCAKLALQHAKYF